MVPIARVLAAGAAIAAGCAAAQAADDAIPPPAALVEIFRRPAEARPDPGRTPSPAEALGRRLFAEKRLSADGNTACATCHDPGRGFTDGRRRARGIGGIALQRNTPTLWNVGFGKSWFWDGRAASLEAQARVPIEHPEEMASTLADAVSRIAADAGYRAAFASAFPARPEVDADNMIAAVVAYERSLVSPPTRFDRWIDGDATALGPREVAGFRLFAGKGRCIACHGGWRFTDDRFHDTGLRSADPGRGALPGAAAAPHTFKTPSLRELAATAPYMHDGSLASLDAVVAHYAGKRLQRASLADELRRAIALSPRERRDLVAFLLTLSSEGNGGARRSATSRAR